jgi:hypothetical protein
MFSELSAVAKSVEEILIDLMDEKFMSVGIQYSFTKGMQASPSTSLGSGPSQAAIEKITNHRDDLANAKLIPSDYIPPLAGVVSRDSVVRNGLQISLSQSTRMNCLTLT